MKVVNINEISNPDYFNKTNSCCLYGVMCYCPAVRMDYDLCYIENSDVSSLNTDFYCYTLS